MTLTEIAFPYRVQREYGVVSFSFVFVMLVVEIELVVGLTLAVVAHRSDWFLDLQSIIFPAAVAVSLVASTVFAWRARSWTKRRIAGISEWGGRSAAYGEKLAARTRNATG